jgi:hypothetical protein
MKDQEEEMQAIVISPDSLYQQDKATVDMQVATAHQYPRSIKRATDNILAIVTMDQETAETCTYTVPRGSKRISGPSVHLAKIIAQQWGNMRIQAKVVSIEDKQLTSQGIAWDLESNVAIQVEVKRSIMSKTGRYSDDMITVTGNASNSIALRNAILSVVPKAVITKCYKAALGAITGDVSDENKLKAKRRQVVDALVGTYKVVEKDVLDAIGRASMDHITADDIVALIGIGTAIKDGDTTVAEAFKKKPVVPTTADKEKERILALINDSVSVQDLMKHEKHVQKDPALRKAFDDQKIVLEQLAK